MDVKIKLICCQSAQNYHLFLYASSVYFVYMRILTILSG